MAKVGRKTLAERFGEEVVELNRLTVPRTLLRRLQLVATQTGATQAHLRRVALEEYLARREAE